MSRPPSSMHSPHSPPLTSLGLCSPLLDCRYFCHLLTSSPYVVLSSCCSSASLAARSLASGVASGGTNIVPCASPYGVLSSCFRNSLATHRQQLMPKGQSYMKFKLKRSLGTVISAQLATGERVMNDPVFTSTVQDDVVKKSVSILKLAAKTKKVQGAEVLEAMKLLEKAKLDPSNFLATIGGTESPGRTWMLVFVGSTKKVTNGMKSGGSGGGRYFPITAVQRFDAATMSIENGVYLGPLGFLTFQGRFSWDRRIMSFIFSTLNLKIGPLSPLKFNINKENQSPTPGKKDPFFVWHYADDEIIVSRGRSGGLAFWCRCKKVST